jgi:hypothetical protein
MLKDKAQKESSIEMQKTALKRNSKDGGNRIEPFADFMAD